jgi:hypothetical protein
MNNPVMSICQDENKPEYYGKICICARCNGCVTDACQFCSGPVTDCDAHPGIEETDMRVVGS